jgi:undecaprenyl-diphosphatase
MSPWLETIILGIVEGITEFLPISSTGHLLLTEHFLGSVRSDFFNVGIQSGAVLAVVLVYWQRLLRMATGLARPEERGYAGKLFVAFLVTAVFGLVMHKLHWQLPEDPKPVAWAVFLGAFCIFGAEALVARRASAIEVTWTVAVLVGLAQVLAGALPGTSRSAATIIAAMLLGVPRLGATEFSFLLGIPTMFAATAFKLWEIRKEEGGLPAGEMDQFALGFAVSLVVAFAAVKWLLGFLRTHSFVPFAWYRLALGAGLLLWFYL